MSAARVKTANEEERMHLREALVITACVLAASCGGGGGGSEPPPTPTLVLLAGFPPSGSGPTQGDVDAIGINARFNGIGGIAVDGVGNVYVLDTGNRKVRKVSPTGAVTTFVPLDSGARTFYGGIAADEAGNVFVTRWDQCPNDNLCVQRAEIERIDPTGKNTAVTIPAIGDGSGTLLGELGAIARARNGDLYFVQRVVVRPQFGTIFRLTPGGNLTAFASAAPSAMTFDDAGTLYGIEFPVVRTIAAGGMLTNVGGPFSSPSGLAVDTGSNVYVSDSTDQVIRKITPSGIVTIIAGILGSRGYVTPNLPGTLNVPTSMALQGRDLYFVMDNAVMVIHNVP